MTNQKYLQICERLLNKNHLELKKVDWCYKDGQWSRGCPIWIKRIDKQSAEELKAILEPLKGKDVMEIIKIIDNSHHWVSKKQTPDFSNQQNLGLTDRMWNVGNDLDNILQELEEVAGFSTPPPPSSLLCSKCQCNLTFPCFGRLQNEPTYSFPEKWCQKCFGLVEKNYRDNKWISYIEKLEKATNSLGEEGESWTGSGMKWKEETKSWWLDGFGGEKEIYRPTDNNDNNKPNKPNKPTKYLPFGSHNCQGCGGECFNSRTGETKFIVITWYFTDYSKKKYFFGTTCSCVENHKKNNQETCSQCKKSEFPDMAKGWLLDYGLKMAFCSPECHCTYRNVDIDEVSDKDISEQVILYPPQLEITSQGKDKNLDLEKEAEKKEILYLRETVKELERNLEKSKQKPIDQQHPKEVKRQQNQISYLLKLHQNTQQKAEQAYQTKYGKDELDKLFGSDQRQDKKPTNWIPWIVGGGILVLVVIIVWLLIRNNRKETK